MNLMKYARNKEEAERIKILEAVINSSHKDIIIYDRYILVNNRYVVANENVARELMRELFRENELSNEILHFGKEYRHIKRIKEIEAKLRKRYSNEIKVVVKPQPEGKLYKWIIKFDSYPISELYNETELRTNILTLVSTENYSREYEGFLKKFLEKHFGITVENFNITSIEIEKSSRKTKFILDPKDEKLIIIRRDSNAN